MVGEGFVGWVPVTSRQIGAAELEAALVVKYGDRAATNLFAGPVNPDGSGTCPANPRLVTVTSEDQGHHASTLALVGSTEEGQFH